MAPAWLMAWGRPFTLPIFEGGRLEAELKNQQAAYDAAAESYNGTLLAAVQQVADSLAEWRQTLEHDAAQERALEAAEAASELAGKRYQAGLSTRDGIIEADAALIRQRLTASETAQRPSAGCGRIDRSAGRRL